MYIHIYREILTCTSQAYSRAPECTQTTPRYPSSCSSWMRLVYIYIYIYIYRERDT